MMQLRLARILIYFFSVCLIWHSRVASADFITDYAYPYTNSNLATATYAILQGTDLKSRPITIQFMPERQKTPLLENRAFFRSELYAQKRSASLVVIVPGLGGGATTGAASFLADVLYRAGYHVLVVPSPMNWISVLGKSRSGIGGITEDDSKDLYEGIQASLKIATSSFGIRVKDIGVLGWSLGALEAAFLSELDSRMKKLSIRRTLLINPPVNLLHGAGSLDGLADIGSGWPEARRSALQTYAVQVVMAYLEKDIREPGYFDHLDQVLRMTDEEIQYVMGEYFRSSIGEVVFVSQQIRDMGVLPTRDPYNRRRIDEAARFDFMDYILKIVMQGWKETRGSQPSLNEMNQMNSLTAVESHLKADQSVYLMHNVDDMLLAPGDADYLNGVFGHRSALYPSGGHVGNIWYADNKKQILSVFSGLAK